MRKIIIFLLILCASANVFAQRSPITIRGHVDTVFVPFQYIRSGDKDFFGMGMGRYADNNRNVLGSLNLDGKLNNMGLYLHFMVEGTGNLDTPGFASNSAPTTIKSGGLAWGFSSIGVWYQPFTFVRFDVGKFRNTDLNGTVSTPWTDAFTVGGYDKDEIFSCFRSWSMTNAWGDGTPTGTGTPIEERNDLAVLASFSFNNLSAYLMLPGLWSTNMYYGQWYGSTITYTSSNGYPENNVMEVYDRTTGYGDIMRVLERTQFAVGYTISGIGLARVQYIGANATSGYVSLSSATNGSTLPDANLIDNETRYYNTPRVEAAFQLTSVNRLNLDIGMKYHLPWYANRVMFWDKTKREWSNYMTRDDTGFLQKSFQVSVGAAYTVGSGFIINGRVDTRFAGTYDNQNHTALIKLPFEFNCHLWPTYALGSTALVGVDLGLECLGKKTQGDIELLSGGVRAGGGVWVEGRWGSCTIRAAALYRAPDEFNGYQEDMVFTIPISFSFTF